MESLLKQVIIRVDYSPISNFIEFIMKLRNTPEMMEFYELSREIKTNNVNLVLNQNKDELQEAKLSVNETTSVFRFYGNSQIFNQKSEYDIGESFMCLTIACDENYSHCSPFLEFVSQRVIEVKKFDPYARIKRIGLRKIDSEDFNDVNIGNDIFNNLHISLIERKDKGEQTRYRLKQNYSEHFFYEKQKAQMISTQGFNGTVDKGIYRFVLDTDAFIEEGNIDNKSCEILKYISEILHSLNEMLRDNYLQNVNQDVLKAYRNGRGQ